MVQSPALTTAGLPTIAILSTRTRLGPWGHLLVFVSKLISGASISVFVPLPAHAYAKAMAITLAPYLSGLTGGAGAGLRGLTGCYLGKRRKKVVRDGGRSALTRPNEWCAVSVSRPVSTGQS